MAKAPKKPSKNELIQMKIEARAQAILKHLYRYIDDTRDLVVDEEDSELERITDESLVLMRVAASFSAYVIEETSKEKIDINIVYEAYLTLLDIFLDEKEEGKT